MQQVEEGEVFAVRLLRQVAQAKVRAIHLANNRFGFCVTAFADQPARGFRGAHTHQEQQRTNDRSAGQGQTPGVRAAKVQQRFAEHIGCGGTGKPQDGEGGQARPAVFLRQKLHQEGGRHRVFNAHRHAV